jgi:hypothetical protein
VRRTWVGLAGLGALVVLAVALIAVELSRGALDYGEQTVAPACVDRPAFPGSGVDATIQRIVLDGLDGAACELGVTREQLVLSLDERSGYTIDWDKETIEQAVRAGLLKSVDEAENRGSIPGLLGTVVKEIIERAPIAWLIEGGGQIAGLLN